MQAEITALRLPVEKPYQQNEDGSFYFQTCITPGGAVGGVHLTVEEISERLLKSTGRPGKLEYDGERLWWNVGVMDVNDEKATETTDKGNERRSDL